MNKFYLPSAQLWVKMASVDESQTTPVILAAEDEESDVFILRRGFKRLEVAAWLTVVPDGQEAINYLKGEGPYADRAANPLPSLILLDLKMPRVGGFEVLEWLRQRPQFQALPVIIYSSSNAEIDLQMARALGASDYVVKPVELEKGLELIRSITSKWLRNPPRPPAEKPAESACAVSA